MTRINPQRGEIWLVDLEPVVGSEIAKNGRPVLVLQIANVGYPSVRICAPITDYFPERDMLRFWRVPIGNSAESGLTKMSCADTSQVRALDIRRFGERVGVAHPAELEASTGALATIVGR